MRIEDIKKYVEDYLGCDDLREPNDRKHHAKARFIYYRLCRMYTRNSFDDIGESVNRSGDSVKWCERNNRAYVSDRPLHLKCLKDFHDAYQFILSDDVIAETPFNIYQALKKQHARNDYLSDKVFWYKLNREDALEELKKAYSVFDGLDEEQVKHVIERIEPIVAMTKTLKLK